MFQFRYFVIWLAVLAIFGVNSEELDSKANDEIEELEPLSDFEVEEANDVSSWDSNEFTEEEKRGLEEALSARFRRDIGKQAADARAYELQATRLRIAAENRLRAQQQANNPPPRPNPADRNAAPRRGGEHA